MSKVPGMMPHICNTSIAVGIHNAIFLITTEGIVVAYSSKAVHHKASGTLNIKKSEIGVS